MLLLTASPNHADLAYTWKNIGEIYLVKHDGISALEWFEQAWVMYHRLFTLDGNHHDIAKCWHLLGRTNLVLERHTDAFNAFEIALCM